MVGKNLSHYKILEELGRGGMGVVYKAEDTKLDRTVAIKVMPSQLGSTEEDRKRFVREAQSASALDHPNICIVHEIGETDEGQMFIVMAFYDGKPLDALIGPGGIDVDVAFDYAGQVGKGLARAHEAGIVHRDIKPGNVIITDRGVAKIVDFGLAKSDAQTVITRQDSTVGTVAYMSPEQSRGEGVDQRTDIWALGTLLYEMIAGIRPFKGSYDQAIIYSILNENPPDIVAARPDLTPAHARIIYKCLKKDANERYQSADDFLADIGSLQASSHAREVVTDGGDMRGQSRKWSYPAAVLLTLVVVALAIVAWPYFGSNSEDASTTAAAIADEGRVRLAVLPFSNLKPSEDTNYLGLSLASEIIANLQYLENITVRPFASVRKYEGQIPDVNTAAKDLDVGHILSATYLNEGGSVRLNVDLINVDSNETVWAKQIQVQFENAFGLSDSVAAAVIDGLKIQFSPQERGRMITSAPSSVAAYEYFLRARAQPSTIDGNTTAIGLLNRAIELDESFAPAYAERGSRTFYLANFGLSSIDENIEDAEADYNHALELNPELPDALLSLSMLKNEAAQSLEAVRIAVRMLEINPNNALAHFAIGYAFRYNSMLEESAKWMNRAIELDPSQVQFRAAVATFFYLGQYQRALEVISVDDGDIYELWFRGFINARQGNFEAARSDYDQLVAVERSGTFFIGTQIVIAWMDRDAETVNRVVRESMEIGIRDGESYFYYTYESGDLLDIELGIEMIRRAIDRGYNFYSVMETDPVFDRYRTHPEFQQLIDRARTASDEFALGVSELGLPDFD